MVRPRQVSASSIRFSSPSAASEPPPYSYELLEAPLRHGADTLCRGDTTTVRITTAGGARVIIDPDLPDGFVVRTRRGRRLALPELRPAGGARAHRGPRRVARRRRRADGGFLLRGTGTGCPEAHHHSYVRRLRRDVLDADFTQRPYEDRRSALEALQFFGPIWATLPRWPGSGAAPFCSKPVRNEGLLWKRAGSPYRSGICSSDWRKTKCSLWREHLERRRRWR